MLARAAARSLRGPTSARTAQIRSYTSIQPQILGNTLGRYSPAFSPSLIVQSSYASVQSRSYAKNRNKKPSPSSYRTYPSHHRTSPNTEPPAESTSIPAASRTASASEGSLDGTGFRGRLSNTSERYPEVEEFASARNGDPKASDADTGEILREAAGRQTTSPSGVDPSDAQRDASKPSQSSRPLPDLTQGIPSTLDAELAQSSAKSHPESLNITEDPEESSGKGGGDLPKTAYISSFERRRNRFANYFYASTLFAALTGAVVLGRNWETEEEEQKNKDAPNGWGLRLFYNRASARLAGMLDYYNEPAFPKLLPNVDPAWERPYTLVLSLEDMLVHSEWDREHGWRMAKRPGVDYFLRYLSQYYELVIFTSVPSMIGQPIISKLDPYHIVMWPLFREATRYKKGEYIKVRQCLTKYTKSVRLQYSRTFHS